MPIHNVVHSKGLHRKFTEPGEENKLTKRELSELSQKTETLEVCWVTEPVAIFPSSEHFSIKYRISLGMVHAWCLGLMFQLITFDSCVKFQDEKRESDKVLKHIKF